MQKRVFANNQIRAQNVRLIDKDNKQLGIFSLQEAIEKARQYGLDLIQVTEKVEPPVCKIMEYGKYLYHLRKKERKAHQKREGELKNIRLGFNISQHDLETRVKAAEKFLKKGYKIRLEMQLRGREKALSNFAQEKIRQFLELLERTTPFKIERELKREFRGLTMLIAKQ